MASEQHKAAASGECPAARTQAAAQWTAEMALPLLLQHASVRAQLPVVCRLLCCSKSLAAAVAEHCAGHLDMPQLDRWDKAEPWLRKHARLLRSLDLFDGAVRPDPCVAALVAAGPQSLALQSLGVVVSDATLALLAQLPASRLTHLEFALPEWAPHPATHFPIPADPVHIPKMSAALDRLTALRSLALHRLVGGAAPLSGLAALAQLTALTFNGYLSDLQHAPPQLLELQLDSFGRLPPTLELRRLAAATALTIRCVPVSEADVLPPNLQQLQLNNCRSVRPLLPLVQLQQLHLGVGRQSDITADQLRQLSRITALSLEYQEVISEPASARAWPLLPLQQLALSGADMSAPVCQHLAQLSGLTSLLVSKSNFLLPRNEQLAAALRQLSSLQRLELSRPLPVAADVATSEEQQEEERAGVQQLLQAVGSLQQVHELDLRGFSAAAAAAAAAAVAAARAGSSSLAGMAALTGLSLLDCDLAGAAVSSIVSQLPRLQSLNCSWNPGLTDAALAAIGRLQQLTKLSLSGTAVADEGMQHLAGLTQLQHLAVDATGVTWAGLSHLVAHATRLRHVSLPWQVTAEQRRWLGQQLPGVTGYLSQ